MKETTAPASWLNTGDDMETLPFNKEQILSVYSGKAGHCACGCSGTYWYAESKQDAGTKYRGYAVRDEELSDRQVSRIYNLFMKNVDDVEEVTPSIFSLAIGKRWLTIYLG